MADIMGLANASATVTVNSQSTYRKGEYFRKDLKVDNSAAAQYLSITNIAVLNSGTGSDIVATNIGNVYVPKTPEVFGYDADGNLTNDGRWSYTWDAENRLISMQSFSTAPTTSKYWLQFTYDWQGRRIQKVVYTNNGGWVLVGTNKFVYDGWNLIAALNGSSALTAAYTWGTDLSGSMQGAGGVGGLLFISGSGTQEFVCHDGNGNVTMLANAADGTPMAQYEYGPFGEVIRMTGQMAKANPFRFSSKYTDDESDLVYYGYRYYNPSTGRWLSRDPKGERGGLNVYGFLGNDAISHIDSFGLNPNSCDDDGWAPTGDGVSYWVRFIAEKCEVTLILKVGVNSKDEATRKKVTSLMPAWQKSMGTWYSGWTLVQKPKAKPCSCCNGKYKLKFDISFTDAASATYGASFIDADLTNERSKERYYHLGDVDFATAPYVGVAHEVGHLFGLPDEYPDKDFPDRIIPSDWKESLMGAMTADTKLLLRHKQRITQGSGVDSKLPGGPFDIVE